MDSIQIYLYSSLSPEISVNFSGVLLPGSHRVIYIPYHVPRRKYKHQLLNQQQLTVQYLHCWNKQQDTELLISGHNKFQFETYSSRSHYEVGSYILILYYKAVYSYSSSFLNKALVLDWDLNIIGFHWLIHNYYNNPFISLSTQPRLFKKLKFLNWVYES